ncbi:MAG: hypothetical protein GTN76_09520 [Candidatus Aenigmarchaeota archaeon]|nr:hypothetical protein [Candidatus Aenigmarchaeota archaeon]
MKKCPICEQKVSWIPTHLKTDHGWTNNDILEFIIGEVESLGRSRHIGRDPGQRDGLSNCVQKRDANQRRLESERMRNTTVDH